VLDRCGGTASIRDLRRSWGIQEWEVEQSAQLGWLDITVQKPRTGRPSRKVAFRDYDYAKFQPKFPPFRSDLERPISTRTGNLRCVA
jgi:hypothetical protein